MYVSERYFIWDFTYCPQYRRCPYLRGVRREGFHCIGSTLPADIKGKILTVYCSLAIVQIVDIILNFLAANLWQKKTIFGDKF